MSSIPYREAEKINRVFAWPERLFQVLIDLFGQADLLGFVMMGLCAQEKKFRNPLGAYVVFRHLIFRTFPFYKIFEFIKHSDVTDGKPRIGCPGAPISSEAVKRILGEYSKNHFIIKLSLPWKQAQTSMYGLNIPTLLRGAQLFWTNAVREADERKADRYGDFPKGWTPQNSFLAARASILLDEAVTFTAPYKEAFDLLANHKGPIDDLPGFTAELGKLCPEPDMGAVEYEFKDLDANGKRPFLLIETEPAIARRFVAD